MKRKLLYFALLVTLIPFVKVNAQAPPIAAFAYDTGIDTVWLSSPYTFVNNSINDVNNYWDITPVTGGFSVDPTRPITIPGLPQYGSFMASSRNFRYTFDQIGTYRVKLVTRNNFGIDSLSKIVYVGLQTRKPVANFFIEKQLLGRAEEARLFDLSQNGPTEWYWYLDPPCYNCGPSSPGNNLILPSQFVQIAGVKAIESGTYGVCLVARNNIGVDTMCRRNYLKVIAGTNINATGGDTIIKVPESYLYDNIGPGTIDYPGIPGETGSYITCSPNGSTCFNELIQNYYYVDPCASRVDLYVERFRMRPLDSMLILDGSRTGPSLARWGGRNFPTNPHVVSNLGKIVIEWKVNTTVANLPLRNAPDSGFVFRYTSVPATYPVPTASFTSPDVVYSGYTIHYTNTSTGSGNLTYAWDADGTENDSDPNNNNGYEIPTKDAFATFTNNSPAEISKLICLRTTNCKGTSTFCKRIYILPITASPVANFTSPQTSGFTTDRFDLVDASSNGALAWEWSFTPNVVTFQNGTNKFSQNPQVKFNNRGRYAVKLKVTNPLGVDSIEKPFFFDVISYDFPNSEYPLEATSLDVGISRVRFADVDTSTALKTPTYDTLFTRKTGVMYRGVNYPIEAFRTTAADGMDRKMWIDLSLDGDFLDSGELIYSETNAKALAAVANFQIPNSIEPGRILRLRVGVSVGNSELTSRKATTGCFEDYGIEIGTDTVKPVVTLLGNPLLRLQLNKTVALSDSGILAIDNHEGNISHKYEFETNLDSSKVGYYYKKYFVKDLYGNVSDTVYRTIQVEINVTGPKLALNANDSVFVSVKKDTLSKLIAKPTAINHLGAPIDPAQIKMIGSVDSLTIGNYVVTWFVKDEFDLTDTIRQRFYVRDVTAPRISTLLPNNIIKHQIRTGFDARRGLALEDNYYNNEQLTLTSVGSVNENVAGMYSVMFTLCDPSGNCSAPLYAVVDVRDTIPPTITLVGQNPWYVDVYTNKDSLIEQDKSMVFIHDNFYKDETLLDIRNYDNVNTDVIGVYRITYRVKDGAGNETTAIRLVHVVDRESPSIELLGPSTLDLVYMDTLSDDDNQVKIHDNYESDADLQLKLVKTTTLDIDPASGKWFGGHRGWKEVRYNVTDASGNAAREMKRTIYVEFRTGLNNAARLNGALSVYPNPNSGVFTISLKESVQGTTTIALYNILGAKVYTETLEAKNLVNHDVSAGTLAPGVYVLNVINNGKQFTQKITIK